MLKIGLTGGIGCGKSIVAKRFKNRGIHVIDADEIAHSLSQVGATAWSRIVEHFGETILQPDREINRAALREIVFNSPAERKVLEGILHPLIYQRIEYEMSRLQDDYCIVSVPLLVETGRSARFDRILVVDCPVDLQFDRVRMRNQLDPGQIAQIIGSQASREEKLSAANDVIQNDSDLDSLDKQVEKFHNFYIQLAKTSG